MQHIADRQEVAIEREPADIGKEVVELHLVPTAGRRGDADCRASNAGTVEVIGQQDSVAGASGDFQVLRGKRVENARGQV